MKLPKSIRLSQGTASLTKTEGSGPRQFQMLAYTGDEIEVPGLFGDVRMVLSLDGMQVSESMPILRQHDPKLIVGMATGWQKANDGLRLSGPVYDTPSGDEVMRLSDQGFRWQASVGADLTETAFIDEGESIEANGRTFDGPLVYVKQSHVKESSFVPLGKDSRTAAVVLSWDGGVEEGDMADQVKQVEAAAAPSTPKSASLADLKARFSDPAFVLEQLESGASIDAAELAWHKREVARLKAELEQTKSRGNVAVGLGAAPATAQCDPIAKFESRIKECKEESGGNRLRAVSLAISRFKDEYQSYLSATNGFDVEWPPRHKGGDR